MSCKKSIGSVCSEVVKIGLLSVVVLISVFAAASAEPLFNDSFSTPATSHQNWYALTADNRQLVFENGAAQLENSSAIYSGFAIHTLSSPLQEYTYSAKLSSPAAGVGIFCCTAIIDGALCGYAVVSGDDELVMLNYDTAGVRQLFRYSSPFPHTTENVLTLSGNGNDVSVFCNGFYQFSYPDSFGRPTGIALVVPPRADLVFDDVTLWNKYTDTLQLARFFDSLKTVPKFFHQLGNGVVDSGSGHLTITTGRSQCYFAGLDLPVERVSASMKIRFSNESTTTGAGFYVGRRDAGLQEGIAPELRVGVLRSGMATVAVSENGVDFTEIHRAEDGVSFVAGVWYQLQFSREGRTVRLSLDGHELLGIDRPETGSFGIGFYTADSGVVDVKEFSCEGGAPDETPVVAPRLTERTFSYTTSAAVDLLGRSVGVGSEIRDVLLGSDGVIVRTGEKIVRLRKQ